MADYKAPLNNEIRLLRNAVLDVPEQYKNLPTSMKTMELKLLGQANHTWNMYFGLASGAKTTMLEHGSEKHQQKIANADHSDVNQSKMNTGHFYFERIISRCDVRIACSKSGTDQLMHMSKTQF